MPRPADKRAKIELLRAAEAVFVEHGLIASKVEDITARAGVSKGAFYLHFDSKDDCWRQIVEAFLAKLATCLDTPPALGPGSAADAFAAQLATWHAHDVEIFEFCWLNRGLMGLLFTGGGGAPYAYLMDEFAERVSAKIEGWARQMMAAGVYRPDVDPTLLPSLISGGYLEAWARQVQAFFIRGLLTDGARAILDRKVSDEASVTERRARER